MGIKIKGLKDIQRKLDELKRKAESASGQIPIEELLSTTFISKYSNFNSFSEMVEKSGLDPQSQEDWDLMFTSEDWNSFISNNTLFSSWEDMISTATGEHFQKHLGLSD
jgi:hypothetical protein